MPKSISKPILFFAILLTGLWPGEPLWVNSWWGILPTLVAFLGMAGGLLGWGFFLEARLTKESGHDGLVYLFSSLAAVAFAFLLGHLGLLGVPGRWLMLAFLCAGVWLAPSFERERIFLLWPSHGPTRWMNFVFGFVFLLRGFSAYIPQAHGDPLLYHLMAPRLWNLRGAVHLDHDLPIPLLAATWEYFFLWPQVLFARSRDSLSELAYAQVLSQWIHLLWGLYGSAFLFRALWRKVKGPAFSAVAELAVLLSMLFVVSMQWTAPLAKNDCGVAFWCLGAWYFAQVGREKKRLTYFLFSGLFAGLALAGKISAVFFLVPLAACYLFFLGRDAWRTKREWGYCGKALLLVGLGASFGALPVYVRNWFETRNPFYTMFSHIFPSYWVSQSWADHFSAHQPNDAQPLLMLLVRLKQISLESPLYWILPIGLLLLFHPRARARLAPFAEWAALFLIAFVLIVWGVSDHAEVRYLGTALWIGAALGAVVLFTLLEFLPSKFRLRGEIILVIALLAASKLPTHILWKFPKMPTGVPMVLRHTAGASKAWLRSHVDPHRLILLWGDNETYYLSGMRVAVVTERPDIDRATYGKTNAADFLRGLCQTSGAGILLDAREEHGLQRKYPQAPWDKVLIFSEGGSRIYDLVKLQSMMLGSENAGCGRF